MRECAEKELQDRERQLELERLHQVETLRQQSDREHERCHEELEKNADLIAGLQKELETLRAGGSKSESPSVRESDSGLPRDSTRGSAYQGVVVAVKPQQRFQVQVGVKPLLVVVVTLHLIMVVQVLRLVLVVTVV